MGTLRVSNSAALAIHRASFRAVRNLTYNDEDKLCHFEPTERSRLTEKSRSIVWGSGSARKWKWRMESFGKSSLKAERKEWENDPNVAASEEIVSPYVFCELNVRGPNRDERE